MANGISQLETRDWVFKNSARVNGHFDRSPERIYFEEFFLQRPSTTSDIDQAYTVEVARAANKDWEVNGTNSTTALVTFASTYGGITLTTAAAESDQMIITPRLDISGGNGTTACTAWSGINWGTENQVIFDTAITTSSGVTSQTIWAGLKLTGATAVATDDDQAFFRFEADADTNWLVVQSWAGADTTVDSGVAVAASTAYRFRIEFDSDRVASFWINDVLVDGGRTAMTNDVDLIPYVGIESAGSAKSVNVHYAKISRILFE